jgi:hypothetical protein
MALMDSPGMIPLLVAVHAVMSLPQAAAIYSWPDTWRLREWPLKAALHRVNEDAYLMSRMYPAYGWARSIDETAGKSGQVFALAEPARAYCSARIIVAEESKAGALTSDAAGSRRAARPAPSRYLRTQAAWFWMAVRAGCRPLCQEFAGERDRLGHHTDKGGAWRGYLPSGLD